VRRNYSLLSFRHEPDALKKTSSSIFKEYYVPGFDVIQEAAINNKHQAIMDFIEGEDDGMIGDGKEDGE